MVAPGAANAGKERQRDASGPALSPAKAGPYIGPPPFQLHNLSAYRYVILPAILQLDFILPYLSYESGYLQWVMRQSEINGDKQLKVKLINIK